MSLWLVPVNEEPFQETLGDYYGAILAHSFTVIEQTFQGYLLVMTGDKGYDDQNLRRLARDHDIRPLIKHREFTSLHKAWNARLDSDLYHKRNMNETVNAAIKQKFGAFVWSRLGWKQFRELVIKCIVHNLERSLAISHEECDCP